jgi:hypothetical protein
MEFLETSWLECTCLFGSDQSLRSPTYNFFTIKRYRESAHILVAHTFKVQSLEPNWFPTGCHNDEVKRVLSTFGVESRRGFHVEAHHVELPRNYIPSTCTPSETCWLWRIMHQSFTLNAVQRAILWNHPRKEGNPLFPHRRPQLVQWST